MYLLDDYLSPLCCPARQRENAQDPADWLVLRTRPAMNQDS